MDKNRELILTIDYTKNHIMNSCDFFDSLVNMSERILFSSNNVKVVAFYQFRLENNLSESRKKEYRDFLSNTIHDFDESFFTNINNEKELVDKLSLYDIHKDIDYFNHFYIVEIEYDDNSDRIRDEINIMRTLLYGTAIDSHSGIYTNIYRWFHDDIDDKLLKRYPVNLN